MKKRNALLPLILSAAALLVLLTACGDTNAPNAPAAPGVITVANSPDGAAMNTDRAPWRRSPVSPSTLRPWSIPSPARPTLSSTTSGSSP